MRQIKGDGNLIPGKKLLLTAVAVGTLAVGAGVWMIAGSRCPGASWLNFEATCRVLDVSTDGTSLIEYFDPDTNELRLYLRHNRQDRQIEHPYGKVKNFKSALRENQLKFNTQDDRTLLVNGEIFPVTPK